MSLSCDKTSSESKTNNKYMNNSSIEIIETQSIFFFVSLPHKCICGSPFIFFTFILFNFSLYTFWYQTKLEKMQNNVQNKMYTVFLFLNETKEEMKRIEKH